MANNSKIEWCHHTDNLWWGCTEVHAGCDHCYARTMARRWNFNVWGNEEPRREIKSVWNDLNKQQAAAAAAGEMHRVFVGSMMDIFEKPMLLVDSKGEMVTDGIHVYPTYTDALRDQLFEEITEGKYPNLLFLLLTKRPSNINKYIPESWKVDPPHNVMFGYSPVDQETANNITHLLQVKGRHFLSVEPMIGEVNLRAIGPLTGPIDCLNGIKFMPGFHGVLDRNYAKVDWVICGGESGPKRRPFDMDAARKLRDDCAHACIPFFMKQIDKVIPIPDDLMIRQFPVIN